MKSRILFSLIVAAIPFFSFAQIDDMYFVPRKETKKQKEQQSSVQSSVQETPNYAETSAPDEYVQGNGMDVDEYNRRYRWGNDNADASEDEAANEGNAREDTVRGTEEDYQYTKRILRFYAPTIGVAVSSPLYWDLRYGPNSIYWDVYDDGFYAYAYPSSWYWGPTFSYSWGWGLYNPYWGWGGHWHAGWYDPWYWRPHWHHPHWGHTGHGWYPSRPVVRPSVRYRERSALARGTSRTNVRYGSPARRTVRGAGSTERQTVTGNSSRFTPNRSSTTNRLSPRTRTTSTLQRNNQPSGSSNLTPSTTRSTSRSSEGSSSRSRGVFSSSRNGGVRSTSRSSVSSSSRSGGSFSPSMGGGTRSTFRPSVSSPSRSGGGFSPSRGGGARGGRR